MYEAAFPIRNIGGKPTVGNHIKYQTFEEVTQDEDTVNVSCQGWDQVDVIL